MLRSTQPSDVKEINNLLLWLPFDSFYSVLLNSLSLKAQMSGVNPACAFAVYCVSTDSIFQYPENKLFPLMFEDSH